MLLMPSFILIAFKLHIHPQITGGQQRGRPDQTSGPGANTVHHIPIAVYIKNDERADCVFRLYILKMMQGLIVYLGCIY